MFVVDPQLLLVLHSSTLHFLQENGIIHYFYSSREGHIIFLCPNIQTYLSNLHDLISILVSPNKD